MKKSQILAAGIAAVSMVQLASAADTTIRVTGSSAFRAAASNAILNIMTFPSAGMGYAYDGGSFTGATYQLFIGSVAGVTGTVTVKTKWTGAVQGIQDVSQGNSITVLPSGTEPNPQAVSPSGTSGANIANIVPEPAEVSLADNLQSSTAFKAPVLDVRFKVGVIPFAFVAGQNTTGFTNITAQLENALLFSGSIPQSLITGVATDTKPIYAVGRDNGSGTRLVTLAETGYGTVTPVTQFTPVTKTGNVLNSIDITANGGDGGEASGGTLADILRLDTTSVADNFNGLPAAPIGLIGYLGENDSYRAVFGLSGSSGSGAGNGRYLTYNGVAGFGGVSSRPANVTSNGSTTITVVTGSTAGVVAGQIVTGTFITPGSVVVTNPNNGTLILDKVAPAGTSFNVQIGSLLPAAIREGAYSFWNYEYIAWKSAVVSGDKATFATALKNRILNFDYGFAGLADDASFHVFRTTDGGVIQHK